VDKEFNWKEKRKSHLISPQAWLETFLWFFYYYRRIVGATRKFNCSFFFSLGIWICFSTSGSSSPPWPCGSHPPASVCLDQTLQIRHASPLGLSLRWSPDGLEAGDRFTRVVSPSADKGQTHPDSGKTRRGRFLERKKKQKGNDVSLTPPWGLWYFEGLEKGKKVHFLCVEIKMLGKGERKWVSERK